MTTEPEYLNDPKIDALVEEGASVDPRGFTAVMYAGGDASYDITPEELFAVYRGARDAVCDVATFYDTQYEEDIALIGAEAVYDGGWQFEPSDGNIYDSVIEIASVDAAATFVEEEMDGDMPFSGRPRLRMALVADKEDSLLPGDVSFTYMPPEDDANKPGRMVARFETAGMGIEEVRAYRDALHAQGFRLSELVATVERDQ